MHGGASSSISRTNILDDNNSRGKKQKVSFSHDVSTDDYAGVLT